MAAITHLRRAHVMDDESGSADPIGDDQTSRSGWGGLDECCADEGGSHREPSRTYRPMTMWQRFCRWLATT